jgi:sugar/nucleoside kinase (ribokinase family)
MNEIDLLTIGDSSIDLFMKVDEDFVWDIYPETDAELCFHHGSKIPVDSFETSIAGNACNVGVGTTKLGMKTAIYTELGEDANGERIIKELKDRGVITDYCIKNPGTPTNVHSIIVYRGDRTIFSYHEERNYKLYDWPKPKWIFYSSLAKGFDKFQGELVEYIKKSQNIGVAVNPGTQQLREGVEALKNILKVTDILFVNKEEAQMLTNPEEDSLEKLHKLLQKLGPKLTVITIGDNGSTAHDGQKMLTEGIYEKESKIMDKTGAGDSYATGFIAALHYKKPLKTAMKWGAANSSHVIRKIGATKGLLNKKQIETLIK